VRPVLEPDGSRLDAEGFEQAGDLRFGNRPARFELGPRPLVKFDEMGDEVLAGEAIGISSREGISDIGEQSHPDAALIIRSVKSQLDCGLPGSVGPFTAGCISDREEGAPIVSGTIEDVGGHRGIGLPELDHVITGPTCRHARQSLELLGSIEPQ